MESSHIYIAIDLKSFYVSIECVERQLDPMNTNLVVADASRTEKASALQFPVPKVIQHIRTSKAV